MSFNLSDVKGVGKKEDTLKEAGIDSVEKLANANIDELTTLKGIGKATAEKLVENAKNLLDESTKDDSAELIKEEAIEQKEEVKAEEELKKLEEKKQKLQGKEVEEGDFILLKITGRTQKGTIFRVSSEEDAKKAGIYDENKAKQGMYTPEFVIVGKPGFLNEGLTEFIKEMKFFEKKSVRIPPTKAYGKRDPQKIERIGIAKFRRLNEGKNPELGQEFVKQTQGQMQRGTVTNVVQGRVIVDYNHPLAGQSVDYNLEIIDKIEDFNEKIDYFMINKGIPAESISDFQVSYIPKSKT
ncbi:MAG: helix-hairpin-helix domain-containing protein, partial [Candidatus Thorarchaeota archaeon]